MLWIKYVVYFNILGYDKDRYLSLVQGEASDGLRDRGWLTGSGSLSAGPGDKISDLLASSGIDIKRDNDGDGIPNLKDDYPNDPNNFSNEKIKEIFSSELSWGDNVRDFFGLNVMDRDGDGVPDSAESLRGTDPLKVDTDADGVYDGEEVFKNLDPKNPDTDGDGVIDGRDAQPLDKYKSIFESDVDTDGDGVGDRFEKILGTDSNMTDTDSDGLRDGIDPNPSIAENKIQAAANIYGTFSDGLSLVIQNKFLAFMADVLTILTLFTIPLSIFIFLKWYWKLKEANEHYYHLFHNAFGYKEAFGHASHDYINDLKTHKNESKSDDSHIHKEAHKNENLSYKQEHKSQSANVLENNISTAPKEKDYINNPKWAIIKSYMSESHQVFWRMGIIEADAMLDNILIERGALGRDLGERLKSIRLESINSAWEAHKVRNRISHEGSNYNLSERDARLTFNNYERVFIELKVI